MTQLRILRLNSTGVGDATVKGLAPLAKLESIGLFRTAVSDTGAQALSKLPALQRIYAAETKITSDTLLSIQDASRDPTKSRSSNAHDTTPLVP
jgi:hypothetical protein